MSSLVEPAETPTREAGGAVEVHNLLEPAGLISAFLAHPPRGFEPCTIRCGASDLVGFVTDFDLTTTLEPPMKRLMAKAPVPDRIRRWLRPKTLFAGTTVSEYLLYPRAAEPREIVSGALERMKALDLPFLILKDIPRESPLLGAEENRAAAELREACLQSGFAIVSGQALAYVPIDFESEADYLQRLSRPRRKDLRRKLRSRELLEIEELRTGDRAFDDEEFLQLLIRLYQNVYAQSLLHFDELTAAFFRSLFRGDDGVVFLYRLGGTLIGYNLCFVHRQRLVDKYVGFVYPEARSANLYFVSWFHNLEWARRHGLREYVAGWTDPEVKSALGARFTFTDHAVYPRSRTLRFLLKRLRRWFEADSNWARSRDVESQPAGAKD